jgi:hypothetical protein
MGELRKELIENKHVRDLVGDSSVVHIPECLDRHICIGRNLVFHNSQTSFGYYRYCEIDTEQWGS